MRTTRQCFFFAVLASGFASVAGLATTLPSYGQSLSLAEAKQIAEDAYIYGYSLITTEVTRVQQSNVPKVEGLTAPMGQFVNVPRYPPADFRGVSAPNADTLYSITWLDLSEPQVFSHPEMGDRFYLFEVVDLWMHDLESSPSKRTAGGACGEERPQQELQWSDAWFGPRFTTGTTSAGRRSDREDHRVDRRVMVAAQFHPSGF